MVIVQPETTFLSGENMSGTQGALRLIERMSMILYHPIGDSIRLLEHALSAKAACETETAEVAKTLTSQLKLRHAAWKSPDHPFPLQQIIALAMGLPDTIELDVSNLPPATAFPAGLGRVVVNLLLLAADGLPEGGSIILAGTAQDLFVRIAGPSAAWPTGTPLCLADEAEAQAALTDGRNLQMALTALLAHAAGIRVSAVFEPAMPSEPVILRLTG
jgi:hypothetical protein